jgi:mannose-6-phosphate isomerase-like protein (cupin superfamily)
MSEVSEKITINKTEKFTKRQASELYRCRELAYPNSLMFDIINDPKLVPPNYVEAGAGTLKLIEGRVGGSVDSFTIELSKRRMPMPFWHRNWDNDELIICISGEATWETEVGTVKLNPGKMIIIPRGIAHSVIVEGNTNYIAIEIKSPSLKIVHSTEDV